MEHTKKNASFCNGIVLGLWGRTDLERCCVCFGTKLGSEGRSTSESCKRRRGGGGRKALCRSLIPLQEGLGLRTYSPLLESLLLIIASKSCRKSSRGHIVWLSQPLCFSLPKSLTHIYIYIYSSLLPVSRPLTPTLFLCPSRAVSRRLRTLVSPPHFLFLSSSFLFFFAPRLSSSKYRGRHEPHIAAIGSRRELCTGALRLSTAAAGLQWDLCTAPSVLLTASPHSATSKPKDHLCDIPAVPTASSLGRSSRQESTNVL